MKLPALITVKDVAGVLELSTRTVQRFERHFGLVRVPLPTKTVRFEKHAALRALVERGLLSPAVARGLI